MEWHKRKTMYQFGHEDGEFGIMAGEGEVDYLYRITDEAPLTVKNAFYAEYLWAKERKPYYKMWPTVAEGLRRVRLDMPTKSILPLVGMMPPSVSIRLPVNSEIVTGPYRLNEVLVCRNHTIGLDKEDFDGWGLTVLVDAGGADEQASVYSVMTFAFKEGTLEEGIQEAVNNRPDFHIPDYSVSLEAKKLDVCLDAVRVYLGLAMIHDNPDMVEAVVLRKDQAKYQATRDPKYVEKAKRRGEYGFNVGANIEVLPHFRRPHFAIRWTGKGSETPKLVPVKGCVVKRSKFTEVPTGYQADEETAEQVAAS